MPKHKSILFGPLPPPMGGVAVFMSTISRYAAKLGVEIWSYKGDKIPGDESIKVRQVNHRRFEHLLALVRHGYKARITDSTHFHLEYPHLLLLPLWITAKFFLRFRWVKVLHDGTLPPRYENFNLLQRLLFRVATAGIDEFVVYDRGLEKWLREKTDSRKKHHFAPLLLPFSPDWNSQEIDETVANKIAAFLSHEKRICSIGIFESNYGFHHVANAVEKLRAETGEDIGLLLIDGLFARDDNFYAQVLKNRKWITPVENVPHQYLPAVFRYSQAFVRAVEYESYGLSKVEALMCNVPVIATNVGETRGMLLYKYGDEASLATHLKKVLSGNFISDNEKWIEIYRREAEQNLEGYLRIVSGISDLSKKAAN